MIPVPVLNQQNFKEIYESMKIYMSKHYKGQKDDCYQDPGETLLELFSLLGDMQGFYMDFIGDEHYLKYLRLLGYSLEKMSYSSTMLKIEDTGGIDILPAGFAFWVQNIIFETAEPLEYSQNSLEKILSYENGKLKDYSNYPFGYTAKKGNGIYLGFSRDLSSHPVGKIFIDAHCPPIPPWFLPLGRMSAEVLTLVCDSTLIWTAAEKFSDNSCCMMKTGFLTVATSNPMHKYSFFPQTKELYWLRLLLEENFFELSPKVEKIDINVVTALQAKTWCGRKRKRVYPPHCSFIFREYLALYGKIEIFEVIGDKYVPVQFTAKPDIKNGCVECFLPKADIAKTYELFYYDKDLIKRQFQATKLPKQVIVLNIPELDEDSVEIQVGSDETFWQDWVRVENFHLSKPHDPHFLIQNGALVFGNREQGGIPAGYIKLVACKSSLGAKGNIRKETIKECVHKVSGINITEAKGGRDRQTISEVLEKIPNDFKKISKAVTALDYEIILSALDVLPLEQIRVLNDPKNPEKIKIIARPKSNNTFSQLNERYRQNILKYLAPYRLLSTEIVFETINYCGVQIKINMEFDSSDNNTKEKTIAKLTEYYPCQNFNKVKIAFGETIRHDEVFKLLYTMPWIKSVKSLEISPNNKNFETQRKENLLIYINSIELNG